MLTLAYRNLRSRPGRTLLAALAIALGVSMIFAMRIVAATVQQTATEVRAGRLAGADLEVTAADHALLSATLAVTLAARPEVAAAVPVYRRTAWVPVDYDWAGHPDHWEPVVPPSRGGKGGRGLGSSRASDGWLTPGPQTD